MNLTIKLYATLTGYLPKDASDHMTLIEADESVTPHQIIDRFNVPREMAHLILINGVYVQPNQRDMPVFKEGDVLAVWPPVAGG